MKSGMRARLILAVVGSIGVAGSVWAQAAEDTLRIRLNSDIRSTDPGTNRDANTDAVVAQVLEGLVGYKENTAVGMMLAKSVDVSADGKTYAFTLRDGVKFSNGAPLTSDDVLFAWKRYMTPSLNWRCLPEFDGRGAAKVTDVQTDGPSKITFTLAQPAPMFLSTMARTDCGSTGIYHRSSLDDQGKWRAPIGTGPFKLGEWKRDQYIDMPRNEHYQALPGERDGSVGNKTPLVAKVRFMIVPDAAAAKNGLLTGGLDIIPNIEAEDVPSYKGDKAIVVESAPTMTQNAVLFQTRDPLLKDVRIRRAIAMALDVPEIVDTATSGTTKASVSPIPLPSPFYGKLQAAIPARNLDAAKQLLKEAGYHGQPIKLLTTKRYPQLFTMAVTAQAMALDAGINIEVDVLDWATLLDHYTKGTYQSIAFIFSSRFDPSLSYEMITGDKDKQPRKVWDNPEAIKWLDESSDTADTAQRQALFDKLEKLAREDVPAIFMFSDVRASAARTNVKGYRSWPLGQARAFGVSFAKP